MRRFWAWLGLNLGRRAGTVAIVGLAVTVVFGIGVTKLRFTTSNSDYLNRNDPAWVDNTNYEKVFGGDPMAVMFTMRPGKTVADLFTPANQAEFKSIEARLGRDPWVFSVVTPFDAMELSQALLSSPDGSVLDSPAAKILLSAEARDPSPRGKTLRAKYLIAEGTEASSFTPAQENLANPKWATFLIHEPDGKVRTAITTFVPNNTHAFLAIYLIGNLNINQESTAAQSVQAILNTAHFQNTTVITAGVPALLKTINDYLKHGIITLALIAALVMVLILAIAFNVRWRELAFFVVALGMVWAFGLLGFLGIPLTLITIAALPVLLGVGMDYSIQMHSRIEEEVVLDRAPHPIQAAAAGLGPALLVVTFDAVFAFMALWFAKTPAVREFGSLMVVGIIGVCICSIVATLAILGIREYKSPTKGKDFSQGRLSRFVAFLGSVSSRAAVPLALASVVIFLGGVAVEGHLVLQTDPIQWVNPRAPSIININALKAGTGSDNELAANVTTTQPFSDQTVAYVAKLSQQLEAKYPNALWPPAGLVNLVDQFITLPGASAVPPTGAQIEGVYLLASPGLRKTTVANDGRSINVVFRGRTDLLSALEPVVKDLQSGVKPPPGVTVGPGGIAVVGVGLVQNLEKTRILLTYLALLFVGAFLAVRLRSLVRSLLSLVPVLVAVGAVSLIAFALHLKLSPVTAVAGPLVVAVCTEFTSLILLRFVEERGRGLDPRQAMDTTARRTGRAFMVSAMTAIAGIAVLATSAMPLLRDFGIIVAMNVTVALLSALIVLPPILVWADAEGRNWVSRGLVRHDQPVFIEFTDERAANRGPTLVPASSPTALWAEPDDAPGRDGDGPARFPVP